MVQARKLLEQVTRQVQPVMRKHSWRVPLVTEFFPQNPALLVRRRQCSAALFARVLAQCASADFLLCAQGLNVNGGQVIKLRLRRAGDGSFLHYESVCCGAAFTEPAVACVTTPCALCCLLQQRTSCVTSASALFCTQVLGTMLHELCHNEHGPHNAAFYKLLDEITAVRRSVARSLLDPMSITRACIRAGSAWHCRSVTTSSRAASPAREPALMRPPPAGWAAAALARTTPTPASCAFAC